jgi:thiol-disulfide isomerase/thioredoxin
MKKTSLLVLLIVIVLINSCKVKIDNRDYLIKVLNNLKQIKSDSYISIESYSALFDTIKHKSRTFYIKELSNPSDTFIGADFAAFDPVDTSKLKWVYDGNSVTYLLWDEKKIQVHSFINDSSRYRRINTPFINRTKSIIKYALETRDSISIDLKDFGDSIHVILLISNKAVEFYGKPCYMESPLYIPSSRYDIWINRSDDLPYRYKRTTPYETSWITCKNIKFNQIRNGEFIASGYIPPNFLESSKTAKVDLIGTVATNWILKDVNSKTISLTDIKSKVVLIQFSGIGCGPCHMSIPFLKKLATEYKSDDFDFVSIETWSNNVEAIRRYQNINHLNYKFIMSNEEVTKSYQVNVVPAFYFLDKNRVIRKVIEGYNEGTTDKQIRNAIKELI